MNDVTSYSRRNCSSATTTMTMTTLLLFLVVASSSIVTEAFTTTASLSSSLTTRSRDRSKSRKRESASSGQVLLDVTARNGLIYEEIEIGTGRNIFPGDAILCYYEGSYINIEKGPFGTTQNKKITFDATDPGEPAEIIIGVGNVIQGWEIGICGEGTLEIPPMKIGGDRRLLIPSELAYGITGTADGTIPPNTDLEFEISIVNAERQQSGISAETKVKGFVGLAGFLSFMALVGFIVVTKIL